MHTNYALVKMQKHYRITEILIKTFSMDQKPIWVFLSQELGH